MQEEKRCAQIRFARDKKCADKEDLECFSSSSTAKKDKQRKQRTSLCGTRKEKTKKFQTQLLHDFFKSDDKSNHHHL